MVGFCIFSGNCENLEKISKKVLQFQKRHCIMAKAKGSVPFAFSTICSQDMSNSFLMIESVACTRSAFYLFERVCAYFCALFLCERKIEKDTEKSHERLDKINTVCYNKIRENTWASRGLALRLFLRRRNRADARRKKAVFERRKNDGTYSLI